MQQALEQEGEKGKDQILEIIIGVVHMPVPPPVQSIISHVLKNFNPHVGNPPRKIDYSMNPSATLIVQVRVVHVQYRRVAACDEIEQCLP